MWVCVDDRERERARERERIKMTAIVWCFDNILKYRHVQNDSRKPLSEVLNTK